MTSLDMTSLKSKMLSRFKCQGSGNCCRIEGYVTITEPELQTLATMSQLTPVEFKQKYVVTENGWMYIATPRHRSLCFLTQDNRCSHYEGRPKACRSYPDWPEIWKDEDSLMTELAICPGLRLAYEECTQ
jgi:uncharacterized protein